MKKFGMFVFALVCVFALSVPVQAGPIRRLLGGGCNCGGGSRIVDIGRRILPSVHITEGSSIGWGRFQLGGGYQFNFNNGQPLLRISAGRGQVGVPVYPGFSGSCANGSCGR